MAKKVELFTLEEGAYFEWRNTKYKLISHGENYDGVAEEISNGQHHRFNTCAFVTPVNE